MPLCNCLKTRTLRKQEAGDRSEMSVLVFLSRALERALASARESPERHDMAVIATANPHIPHHDSGAAQQCRKRLRTMRARAAAAAAVGEINKWQRDQGRTRKCTHGFSSLVFGGSKGGRDGRAKKTSRVCEAAL
jgi:hypothetical protein